MTWERRFYARDGTLLHTNASPFAPEELTLKLTSWQRAITFGLKLRGDEREMRVLDYYERPQGGGSFNRA